MRFIAYASIVSLLGGLLGVAGCSSDDDGDGAGGSGNDSGGNAGTAGSSGGNSGTSTSGGSSGTSTSGGNGGTGGGSGGTSNGGSGGSGGSDGSVTYSSNVCDLGACQDCFENSDCRVIDNPCNDNASCDPRENKWNACICFANGDSTAVDACNSEFAATDTAQSQPIIDCLEQACPVCYEEGPTTKTAPSACGLYREDCSVCVEYSCASEIAACSADEVCDADDEDFGPCICAAQFGTGTIEACSGTQAGLTAISNCVEANCATECGF